MKILLQLAIGFSFLLGVGQARGEYRTVLIVVTHTKDGNPQVKIRSDSKDEQKESISVDQACGVIKNMVGSGSSVGVWVALEKGLAGRDAEKLLKAIFDNVWLRLEYLGPDIPKGWPAIPPKAK